MVVAELPARARDAGARAGRARDGQFHGARPREARAGGAQALRRPAAPPGAADQRRARHDAARAASVVDDAHRGRVGAALHEVRTRVTGARALARGPRRHGRAVPRCRSRAGSSARCCPAFGYLPAIGGTRSRRRRGAAGRVSGLRHGAATTLVTGVAATLLVGRARVRLLRVARTARRWRAACGAWLAPVLATPHCGDRDRPRVPDRAVGLDRARALAMAHRLDAAARRRDRRPSVGLALVLVPRAEGSAVPRADDRPPRSHQVPAARASSPSRARWATAASRRGCKVVLPQVYPQVRLPIYAVLAFSLSVVDVALILGPGNPPTLAVLAVRWFADADIAFYFPGGRGGVAAASSIVAASIAHVARSSAWSARVGRVASRAGRRASTLRRVAALAASRVAIARRARRCALAIAGMALWSFASQWRFPSALAERLDARQLVAAGGVDRDAARRPRSCVGALATLLRARAGDAAASRTRQRRRRPRRRALAVAALPAAAGAAGRVPVRRAGAARARRARRHARRGACGRISSSCCPYVFLSLADPWRALDPRYARTAAASARRRGACSARVKLPILLRPVAIACAVGFAVSVGPVPADAVRRQRPRRDADDRGGDARRRAPTAASSASRRSLQALLPLPPTRRRRGAACAARRRGARDDRAGAELDGVRIALGDARR